MESFNVCCWGVQWCRTPRCWYSTSRVHTYIDQRTEARLYELLDELNGRCAIVMVSHDTDSLLRHARSLAVVDRELTYYATTAGITSAANLDTFRMHS